MKTIITGLRKHLMVLRLMPDIKNSANGLVYCEDRLVPMSNSWDCDYEVVNNAIKILSQLQKQSPDKKVATREIFTKSKSSFNNEWSIFVEFIDNPDVEYLTIKEFKETYPNDTILTPNDRNLIIPLIGPSLCKGIENILTVETDKIDSPIGEDAEIKYDVADYDNVDEDCEVEEYDENMYFELLNIDDPHVDEDDEEHYRHSSEDSNLEFDKNY